MENQLSTNPYALTEDDLYDAQSGNNTPKENKEVQQIDFFNREGRNFARDKMKLNLNEKKVEFDLPSKVNQEVVIEEVKTEDTGIGKANCHEHPDEELQFYSFTHEKALCPECLLSGVYTGSDVVSLKKAADKIKPKFEDLLQQVSSKAETLQQHEENLINKKIEIEHFAVNFSDEIMSKMNELREAIDNKEREMLEQIDRTKMEKLKEIESNYQSVKTTNQEMLKIQDDLQEKLSSLKDLELCQYYLNKSKSIKDYIEKDGPSKIKLMKLTLQSGDIKNQFSLQQYNEGVKKIQESILNLKGLQPKEIRSGRFTFDNFQPHIEEQESVLETTGPIHQNRKTIHDEFNTIKESRSMSPFRAFKKELEIISPMPVVMHEENTPLSPTDETLRKLLGRVEELRKSTQQAHESANVRREEIRKTVQPNDLMGSKKDLRTLSVTKLGQQLGSLQEKEKDSMKKLWDHYKGMVDDQGRNKKNLTSSTTKLIPELDRNKAIPKSFIPDYTTPKISTGPDLLTLLPNKKDAYNSVSSQGHSYNTVSSQGLSSAKNLRSLIPDEPRQSAPSWKTQIKQNRFKVEDAFAPTANNNRSFGSNSLQSNLKKLKKQMGLDSDFEI